MEGSIWDFLGLGAFLPLLLICLYFLGRLEEHLKVSSQESPNASIQMNRESEGEVGGRMEGGRGRYQSRTF